MASNHPSNYIGLGKKLDNAIDKVNKELDPRKAAIIRKERNEVILEVGKALGEAESKQKEIKGKSKYKSQIKELKRKSEELLKK